MILSTSRRTDIPSYYSEWFFNRIKEKYVLVRNPMNYHQVSRIDLSPEVVDCIVFWTKNPMPMLSQLEQLQNYRYYFQFTLTGYGQDVERNLPSKKEVILPAFQRLSKEIGREKVVWRYDPIFFSEKYSMEYHCRCFSKMAEELAGSVAKNHDLHNPKSPLLVGEITDADVIKERKVKSLKELQLNLFDRM